MEYSQNAVKSNDFDDIELFKYVLIPIIDYLDTIYD